MANEPKPRKKFSKDNLLQVFRLVAAMFATKKELLSAASGNKCIVVKEDDCNEDEILAVVNSENS